MGSPQESFAMFASKVVQLLLLPSALGLVRFPRVQVSQDLQISDEEDAKVLSNDPESDAYIDQILANLATTIIENGLDPATLPDADRVQRHHPWHHFPWLCPFVQRALLALVDDPPNGRHQLHHRGNQGPTHSQHWSGCSNSPLRRLCRVHGHWGFCWDNSKYRRLWNLH